MKDFLDTYDQNYRLLENVYIPGEYVSAELTPYSINVALVVNMEPIRDRYPKLFLDDGEMGPLAVSLVRSLVSYGLATKLDADDFSVEVFSNDATDLIFNVSYYINGKGMSEETATLLAEGILLTLLPFTENKGRKSAYDTATTFLNENVI